MASSTIEGLLIGAINIYDSIAMVYSNPRASAPDLAFRATIPNTDGTAANAIKNQLYHPLVNRDLAADAIRFLGTYNIGNITNATFWSTPAYVPAGVKLGQAPPGLKVQGFTDFSAFDFRNRMLDESSRQGDSFHTFNVALEQRAWQDRVGIEFVFDTQRADRRSRNSFFSTANSNDVRLDTNVTLPTGQPNPNLGRPYVYYGQASWINSFTLREALRATAYLKHDFKDLGPRWGRWLGRHALTGLYEETAIDTVNYTHRLATDGEAARAVTPNINVFARRPSLIAYIGPSLIGNSNPLRLEPINIPALVAGPLPVPARYFVRAANATDSGTFVDVPVSLVEINDGGYAQRDVIKSRAAVLQSYWLREHLVTLVGWRRDEDFYLRQLVNYVANPSDPNDPGKVHYGFDDFDFPHTPPPNAAKDIISYSAVLHWPRQWRQLPAAADASVFFNRSENFTPLGGRVNAYGEALASPQGTTKEYGFNLSMFNGGLNLRANWFETAVKGQTYSPGVYGLATSNATLQFASYWAVEANTNPQLAAMRAADIELLFSPLPANYRAIHNWQVVGTAPNIAVSYTGLAGAGDTTDYTARGTEVELVCNPTRNWRLLANVAKQETVRTNSMPFLKHFIAIMTPVWNQLRNRLRGTYPLGWQPGDPVTGQTVGSYLSANVLVPFATAIATEGTASAEQRKWRANFVANYTFGRGSPFGEKLRGWGFGGAVRWQDKIGIGYPTIRNPDTSVTIDIAHPYYAPADTNVDAWVSYERKLWQDRVVWKVQFNVRNGYGTTDPIAIGMQPWEEVASARLPPERRWYLTNTFSFQGQLGTGQWVNSTIILEYGGLVGLSLPLPCFTDGAVLGTQAFVELQPAD